MSRSALMVFIALALSTEATAQVPAQSGARTLVGVVRDSLGKPIEGAEVSVAEIRRRAATDAAGRFRFEDIKPGTYRVSARRIGFIPETWEVVVGANGGAVEFRLTPLSSRLRTIVTAAVRGGLSGIVQDSVERVIANAEVVILGSGRKAITDATGAFLIPLPTGKYMVRVTRDGFAARMFSVTVPKDSGRRVAVWLNATSGSQVREHVGSFDLSARMARRSPVWSALVTREDMDKWGFKETADLAGAGLGKKISDDCWGVIGDRVTDSLPMWAIHAEDVDAIEIYDADGKPGRSVGLSGRSGGMTSRSSSRPKCPKVYVWLKR